MKRNTIINFCVYSSIGAILAGGLLMFAALSPNRSKDYGEVATGFTPQAILVAGGLIALAICARGRDQGDVE